MIASDKTGTLTENKMVADLVWVPEGFFAAGARSQRTTSPQSASSDPSASRSPRFGLCWRQRASATTRTSVSARRAAASRSLVIRWMLRLVVLAEAARIDVQRLRAHAPRLSETPFDAVTRLMTTRHRDRQRRDAAPS